jgi:hypothetical protein
VYDDIMIGRRKFALSFFSVQSIIVFPDPIGRLEMVVAINHRRELHWSQRRIVPETQTFDLLTVDINGPNSSNVAVVSSKTLAIMRIPDVDNLVLGDREEKIAFAIVLDLCQRTSVTL